MIVNSLPRASRVNPDHRIANAVVSIDATMMFPADSVGEGWGPLPLDVADAVRYAYRRGRRNGMRPTDARAYAIGSAVVMYAATYTIETR